MTLFDTLVLVAYFFILSILAVYGWHRYFLVFQYMKHKDRVPRPPPVISEWPVVTIQLPIYNEMYVVDRLVEAITAIDYPIEQLEIQVLDDSTDETREIAELAVRRQAARGFDIKYLHRTDRIGYKAGALAAGLDTGTWAVHRDLRRRFRPALGLPAADDSLFLDRREARAHSGASGATSIRTTLAPHAGAERAPRRPLRARTRRLGIDPGVSSTSTARPGSGVRRPFATPAAGSTTRSPRISI